MTRTRLVFIGLLFSSCAMAQPDTIGFTGRYDSTPFSIFATEVETQTGLTFYYRAAWVKEIRITLPGEKHFLGPVLDSVLHLSGLHYHIDQYRKVYIADQNRFPPPLPRYREQAQDSRPEEIGTAEKKNTAEQKYFNGRKVMAPEVIHVGSPDAKQEGRRVLLSGIISDSESGEPVIGATLYFPSSGRGTSTGPDGMFSLALEQGKHMMECKSMGMESREIELHFHATGRLDLELTKTLIPLDEVVVRADRYHNVSGSQMGFERLNFQVFKTVPVVMGERDVINVAKLLPGVQSVGEGASGFNVRGSSADQNMIYIDQVPVYNPSHLFGFFTSFSPEVVADFSLYKGHLPASFGGRLASFFDIKTRQGNQKRFRARGGVSSISAYLAAEGPIIKDQTSFLVSARSTYSDWILGRMPDPDLRNSEAGFNDFSAVLIHEAGENTQIKAFAYHSRDHFKLSDISTFDYDNTGASLELKHQFNPGLNGNFAMIYSRYHLSNTDVQEASAGFRQAYQIHHRELRADFRRPTTGKHHWTFGASLISYRLDRGKLEPWGGSSLLVSTDLGIEHGLEPALYVGDQISIGNRLSVYAGFRFSAFLALGPGSTRIYSPGAPRIAANVIDSIRFDAGEVTRFYPGPEPRLNLRYLTGRNNSVKLSYTRGSQYLFMLSNTVALAPTDQWKLCDYHIGPQYMDQVSAGFYQDLPRQGLSTSIELYRKWGHHIVEYRDGASLSGNPYVESETLQGELKATGIEAMIRRDGGMLNGWMSYCYSRSFIRVEDEISGEQINGGRPYPSNYDRPHNFTLVLNFRKGRRVSFSSNVVYMTGRPTTYPLAVYYEYDLPYIHYAERNSYRIPDYFRVDLSMNIEGNLRKNKPFHSFWMLNIYNLTGRKNAYSIFFDNNNGYLKGYKLSIFAQPIVSLSWNLKLGNYASK